jgi:uncharacterized RDD family membrane protein YckC
VAESSNAGRGGDGRRRSLFAPIGRIVDTVVPTVTDAIDVDDVVRRIDVDDVVRRIDVEAIAARVDVDALVNRIDMAALVDRLDVDALVNRIDLEALIDRVDVEALVNRIDVEALISRVDINDVLDRVDVNRLLGRVDVDAVMSRVDIDAVVDRVDVDDVVGRIDVDGLLGRVDVDTVISRVDVDAIVDRVDVDRVVQRADLAGLVAQSTRGITASTVDLVRRQLAGIDELVTRIAARVVRRDPNADPAGPAALLDVPAPTRRPHARPSITGHYAGPVARTAALALDWVTMLFLFGVFTAMGSWIFDLLIGGDGRDLTIAPVWSALLLGGWAFLYFAVPMAVSGRTFGKAVVGLRVVGRDGAPLGPGHAIVRVLVLPVSFLLFGLGLVGAVFGRRRRTLHDVAARSVEVIDWGDRPAALPTPLNNWLVHRQQRSATSLSTSAADTARVGAATVPPEAGQSEPSGRSL